MYSKKAAAIVLALAILPPARAQTDDVVLKAAYIYNIAQFTLWPVPTAARPLTICVASDHALWQSLHQLQGKPVGERKVAVVELAANTPCDMAVLRTGARRPVADGGGTLAIVDQPDSGYAGAVALVEEDQHLRFDIDTTEAARAGLRFSSRLLRLARNVR